jgi:small basic protein
MPNGYEDFRREFAGTNLGGHTVYTIRDALEVVKHGQVFLGEFVFAIILATILTQWN